MHGRARVAIHGSKTVVCEAVGKATRVLKRAGARTVELALVWLLVHTPVLKSSGQSPPECFHYQVNKQSDIRLEGMSDSLQLRRFNSYTKDLLVPIYPPAPGKGFRIPCSFCQEGVKGEADLMGRRVIPRPPPPRDGGWHLWPQHSECWGRISVRLRPAWATEWVLGQPGL